MMTPVPDHHLVSPNELYDVMTPVGDHHLVSPSEFRHIELLRATISESMNE